MTISEQWANTVQGIGSPGSPDGGVLSVQGAGSADASGNTGFVYENPNVVSILALAARNATTTSAAFIRPALVQGVLIRLNVTANPADAAQNLGISLLTDWGGFGGGAQVLCAAAAVIIGTATGSRSMNVHPGLVAADYAANTNPKGVSVPLRYAVRIDHSGAGNWTYQVDVQYLF